MRRSGFLLYALSISALLAGLPEAFAFQIAVSPMRFEVPLGNKPVRRSMKVINQGKTPLEVGISVGHWDLDNNNKVRNIAPTSQSLDQWLVVSPLKLKIPAGKTRTLRFAIRPFTRPRTGEHRAMIYLDQGGPVRKGANGVSFRFRIGVPVYANVGKPVRHGSIKWIKAKPSQIGFNIENSGKYNVRFWGNYAIWKRERFPGSSAASRALAAASLSKKFRKPKTALDGGALPSTPVLPGYRRTIPIKPKPGLKPGSYKILMQGKLGDAPLNKTYAFTVD